MNVNQQYTFVYFFLIYKYRLYITIPIFPYYNYPDQMRLSLRLRQCFRTLTPEDYLFNQRESVCAQTTRQTSLKPLPMANQGDIDLIDQVQLIGVTRHAAPAQDSSAKLDQLQALVSGGVDLMFLQIDPSDWVARQRFMSHKCAQGGVQDYRLDGVELIDPHRPITWEETVVNLFTIDMLLNNSLPNKTNYKNGLYAYSYPFLQDKPNARNQITPVFVDAISQHVLGGMRSEYPLVDKFLYTGLMGRHKVMLGGMPETLYRMILGKSLTIHEFRDVFRTIVSRNRELTTPFTTRQAAQNFMPHIFHTPKDLYMTALLKQSFQAATQMVCAVGMEHYRPIQEYWIGPPSGINYMEATRIPEGFAGETADDLIQKQAIMDVLLQTRTWSKPYLSNPFPYLFPDISKIQKQQLDHHKQTFLTQYRKYSEFKNRELKQLPRGTEQKLLGAEQLAEAQKFRDEMKSGPKLSHLKEKMELKLNRGFFSNFK